MIFLSLLGGDALRMRLAVWHVHTRQTRWTPPDDDVEVEEDEEEEYEEVEDDSMDEIYAESLFDAGFWPMRMCRWFPSGNCRQGWGCMFAHAVSELHLSQLVVKGRDDFCGPSFLTVTCSWRRLRST